MKTRIKQHLSITKKEWNGLVILVVIIAGVLATPYGYRLFRKDSTINFKEFDKAAAQLDSVQKNGTYVDSLTGSGDKIANPVMFPFDPNGLTAAQWTQLGLTMHQAEVILHYRAKGGHFYKKEDVKKIYAITAADYTRLEPYIVIPEGNFNYKKAKPGEVIELNSADSAKLTSLEGVGPSFAVRIIRYRSRLGGFIYKEQLKEIYGLDSLEFADIKNQVSVNINKVKKININTISFDQLRIFPYLNYKQVNAIIQYRVQHGSYNSITDMKNIVLLDEGILRKIEPYLAFK
ncbi:helix-hairpin-helix domain-containing protein [Mucilaginibacter sp.]|uniref:ComEA family DNA-binding protein n=1 Tax=Mucilaginibacter sp. TaxID=1882438 RepID=UPI00283EA622|nr:helix-hairpin-helix domain-containing protein [Mucilaginibacter sp.]MDR3696387.1 helix-hairpin-helix domain-containing protein [Mucilaginibacter sp.]